MKYCAKCGAQLVDEAVICTACGRMIEGTPIVKKVAPSIKKKKESSSTSLYVFNFVHTTLVAVCVFFVIASIALGNVGVSSYSSYGSSSFYGYYYPDYDIAICALISGFCSIVISVVCFVLGISVKDKAKDAFAGIARMIISALLVLLCLICLGA